MTTPLSELNFILKDTLERLEWSKITESLSNLAVLDSVKTKLQAILPWVTPQNRSIILDETEDALRFLDKGKSGQNYQNFATESFLPLLRREALLGVNAFVSVIHALEACYFVESIFADPHVRTTHKILFSTASKLQLPSGLLAHLKRSIGNDGVILDTASVTLKAAREKVRRQEKRMENALSDMLKKSSIRDALQDSTWTMRDGRYVLPVRSDRKSDVAGITLGVSGSGQTLFIEPAEMTGLQEEYNTALTDVQLEEARILADLSKTVASYYEELKINIEVIEHWDQLFARAQFARLIEGCRPKFHDDPKGNRFDIIDCKHPFFLLDAKKVVSNHLYLGKSLRQASTNETAVNPNSTSPLVLVLSGPNAGGKTLAMKSVGLLFLMASAGLFISASQATFFEYNYVFAEVGDRQNVSDDLSTFSGHLSHLKKICNYCDSRSLVLLDEGFVGTDPALGMALARATLEFFTQNGASVVITTHFSSLKILSDNNPLFVNASMEFEQKKLTPTFKLLPDIPGQSFALELAHRIGFPQSIIDNAHIYYGTEEKKMENLLAELQFKRDELDNSIKTYYEKQKQLNTEIKRLETEKSSLHNLKNDLVTSYQTRLEKRLNAFVNRLETRERQFIRMQEIKDKQRDFESVSLNEPQVQVESNVSSKLPSNVPSKILSDKISAIENASVHPTRSRQQATQDSYARPTGSSARGKSIGSLEDLQKITISPQTSNLSNNKFHAEKAIPTFREPKQYSTRALMDEARESLDLLQRSGEQIGNKFQEDLSELSQFYSANKTSESRVILAQDDPPLTAPLYKKGTKVKHQNFKETGEVIKDQQPGKTMVEVQFGFVKTKILSIELKPLLANSTVSVTSQTKKASETKKTSTSKMGVKNKNDPNIPGVLPHKGNSCDVRGYLVEDALEKVEGFLIQSWSMDVDPVVIIHGHGTGRVKQAVRDHVESHSWKLRFRVGQTNEGGDGATIVCIDEN